MTNTDSAQNDLKILTQLNKDYLAADQNGDVVCYGQMLAEDFTASLPDLLLRDKKQFLEMIAAPRPFTELTAYDVMIRLLGDFAIIHGRFTFKTIDGVQHQGRYTDDYHRRDGKWVCVAANVITQGF